MRHLIVSIFIVLLFTVGCNRKPEYYIVLQKDSQGHLITKYIADGPVREEGSSYHFKVYCGTDVRIPSQNTTILKINKPY